MEEAASKLHLWRLRILGSPVPPTYCATMSMGRHEKNIKRIKWQLSVWEEMARDGPGGGAAPEINTSHFKN
jgi:hypothetical protein